MNYVNPERDRFKQWFDHPLDEPALMLNMLKFREIAAYAPSDPEHGDTTSGRLAYKRYSEEAAPVFAAVGGTQVFAGEPRLMLIGPENASWDLVFIARYPTAQAFVDMIRNPDYQKATRHRTAAVENSRLLRCAPAETGTTFIPSDWRI